MSRRSNGSYACPIAGAVHKFISSACRHRRREHIDTSSCCTSKQSLSQSHWAIQPCRQREQAFSPRTSQRSTGWVILLPSPFSLRSLSRHQHPLPPILLLELCPQSVLCHLGVVCESTNGLDNSRGDLPSELQLLEGTLWPACRPGSFSAMLSLTSLAWRS